MVSVVAIVAGPVGIAGWSPSVVASTSTVQLTGGGTALVMGGSGIPLPSDGYVNAADLLYLQQHGFTGTAQPLFTPQLVYPGNVSEIVGAQLLANAINKEIAAGHVNADNPVYAFGYSQSSAMSSMTMEQLHQQGVPAEDVHFVLVGNPANPNGGIVEMLDIWGGVVAFSNGLMLGHPTPDYYTTDVYTLEYDGYADFPRYPLNLLSTLNAVVGMFTSHIAYLGLDKDDIANAIHLETTDPESLTNYYMIPAEHLPLLDLLRVNPVWGNPLADLLEPSMRILVNLGYGSLTEGWNQGPANVPTMLSFDLLPSNISWDEVDAALSDAWSQGVQAAMADLQDPANYESGSFMGQELFSALWTAAQRVLFGMQDQISLLQGAAPATDPAATADLESSLGSLVDGQLDLPWVTDFMGLDTIIPA